LWIQLRCHTAHTMVYSKLLESMEGGHLPWAMSMGDIAPVPKPKGTPLTMDDHCSIAMELALSKLSSVLLFKRVNGWAESTTSERTLSLGSALNEAHWKVISHFSMLLGLALIPFLVMGLALYPICRIWFPDRSSTEGRKSQRGSLLRI
jgi:hypothetical protein